MCSAKSESMWNRSTTEWGWKARGNPKGSPFSVSGNDFTRFGFSDDHRTYMYASLANGCLTQQTSRKYFRRPTSGYRSWLSGSIGLRDQLRIFFFFFFFFGGGACVPLARILIQTLRPGERKKNSHSFHPKIRVACPLFFFLPEYSHLKNPTCEMMSQ